MRCPRNCEDLVEARYQRNNVTVHTAGRRVWNVRYLIYQLDERNGDKLRKVFAVLLPYVFNWFALPTFSITTL